MAAQPAKPSSTIFVASLNPVKISAVKDGFNSMFPHLTFETLGIHAASGVPDQPFSDEETLRGARNRAQGARALKPEADYWVGVEGGVMEDNGLLQSFAWIVVEGRDGRAGKARTSAYYLPEETARLVRGGMELGPAEDQIWGRTNSKQKNGSVGLLTGDVIDRKAYYVQAVILALIPFKNPTLTFSPEKN